MPSLKKCVAVGCNTDQNSNIVLFCIPRPVPGSWRKILFVNEINLRFFHSSLWNRFVDLFYKKTTFKIVPSCETPYIDAERGPRENCYVHLYSSILALAIYNSVVKRL